MASTLYVDFQQPAVNAAWLNDVNRTQYTILGNPQPALPLLSIVLSGRELSISGTVCFGTGGASNVLNIGRFDNSLTGIGSGAVILLQGTYESV